MVGEGYKANLFFRIKPVDALVSLFDEKREWYASSLAKEIDCTFPHIIKILRDFKELGIVSFEEKGRKKFIFLTPKGRQLAPEFVKIKKFLKA